MKIKPTVARALLAEAESVVAVTAMQNTDTGNSMRAEAKGGE